MNSKRKEAVNGRDIIVIGASAGGISAVERLIRTLPKNLPAAIFVVIHISPDGPSLLPQILQRSAKLKIVQKINDGEPIKKEHVYIAPPDQHLVMEKGRLRLVCGPMENRHRPAIDPLFRSAAQTYGGRVIGVILTGTLDDGASGLLAIKGCGGTVLVQDPKDAEYPDMPRNALKQVQADYQVPLAEMGPLLVELVNKPPKSRNGRQVPVHLEIESDIAEMKKSGNQMEYLGKPSNFACPECHGVLWEMKEGGMGRFRCRVGHAYSLENLHSGMSDAIEDALWSAVRALEEKAALLRRLADEARSRKHLLIARQFERRFKELLPAARTIRSILLKTR